MALSNFNILHHSTYTRSLISFDNHISILSIHTSGRYRVSFQIKPKFNLFFSLSVSSLSSN